MSRPFCLSVRPRSSLTLVLLLGLFASCQKGDLIAFDPSAEEDPPRPYYEYGLGHISVVTDGGAAVDSKEEYRPCTISIDGGDVFGSLDAVRGKIRGRGNSTWGWYPKKPYRFKLDVSSQVMGLRKNKDWVLLADFRDVTHLMNNVAFTLAYEWGLPCANHSRYVTLTLNGRDMGLYMLTEQVEEGKHRVPLDAGEGILLALDMNDGPGENPSATDNFWSPVFKTACAVKYPKDPDAQALSRVRDAFGELEKAIDARDWEEIQRLLDIPSMMRYILIQEIISNGELDNNPSMRSGYIHRPDNASKWVMGPMWDADAGFGYDGADMFNWRGRCHTYFIHNEVLVFGTKPYLHEGAMNGTASDLFCRLWGIPAFVRQLKALWNADQAGLLLKVLDQIDRTKSVIRDAAVADQTLWNIDRTQFSHPGQVDRLRSWLINRFRYLDTVVNRYPEVDY